IVRQKRRRYSLPNMDLDKLPDPIPTAKINEAGQVWRAHLSGVGGMGIGVVNAILVRAGHKQGYRVLFQDKKGLAIRNGGVYSQISFINDGEMIVDSGSFIVGGASTSGGISNNQQSTINSQVSTTG